MQSDNQYLNLSLLKEKQITLAVKREDLFHPYISGNKYRKLKYNIKEAIAQGHDTLLTFGGAYSNHISAASVAAKNNGLKAIGVIRGEELERKWHKNPTLKFAAENNMQFKFVSRELYRNKTDKEFLKGLREEFGTFYLVPEGGTNPLAIKGCEEILNHNDKEFDVITVCVGTGGTISGLSNSLSDDQKVLGFSALKGDFLAAEIEKMAQRINWDLINEYHFGGYGKVDEKLVTFINDFKRETEIPLDPVYTGKMMYGLLDMIKNDNFVPRTKILAIHTGGLQGVIGMNSVLQKKNLPLLDI